MTLFAITNKKTNDMESTNLTAFMVHYLFIDKKWDRDKCIIHSNTGNKMDYSTFCEFYPI